MLKNDIRQIMRWGATNKIAFAPEKLEMVHLSRKRSANSPSINVSPELTIRPVTATGNEQPALRWLGVWIDRKLSFKRHVTERTTKAMKVARHIKGLAGVKFGPPAASLRKAVVTCVQSSVLYGSEVWYGGRLKPSSAGGYNRNQLNAGFRSPDDTPARSPASTLAARNEAAPSGCTSPTRPKADTAQPHFSPGCRTNPTEGRTKEDAAEQFNTWWNRLNGDTITVFSDGSPKQNRHSPTAVQALTLGTGRSETPSA
ncbi:hypothetical protein DID88_006683 [Monilinia fructigena]|uniref:Reverse transcriptase domain-containing protein n=1 Tax=Monilinia fructigena TaxID=38457 RepID=A0A395IIE7_9HELO|nr:hypothetical protein DID88_006683 [Monilinia fructigena]